MNYSCEPPKRTLFRIRTPIPQNAEVMSWTPCDTSEWSRNSFNNGCLLEISVLQHYSWSHRPHGSQSFHDFDWYNSCGTEKCPLAVNGSHWQERPLGAFRPVVFWERPVTKEPAALWIWLQFLIDNLRNMSDNLTSFYHVMLGPERQNSKMSVTSRCFLRLKKFLKIKLIKNKNAFQYNAYHRCSGHRKGGGALSAYGGVCRVGGVCLWDVYHPSCGQTDACENITFLQLLFRMVKIKSLFEFHSGGDQLISDGQGQSELLFLSFSM